MVTELLVRLKSLLKEFSDLIRLAKGGVRWETVMRISSERAESLADVCARIRPKLDEFSRLLEEVEERARYEAEERR